MCAIDLDLFRTNMDIVEDTIDMLQRTEKPLRPDDINDEIEAMIENIEDIAEDCQIKDKKLEEAIDNLREIKREAVFIPLDELKLKLTKIQGKITRAVLDCADQ